VEEFALSRQPIYVREDAVGAQIYGFPALGAAADGVKAAFFRRSTPTVADKLTREVADHKVIPLLDFLGSPCSGHRFKFMPVIREIVADLVTSGSVRFDISLFDPDGFPKTLGAPLVRTDGGLP
jgi:sarcosine oxidase